MAATFPTVDFLATDFMAADFMAAVAVDSWPSTSQSVIVFADAFLTVVFVAFDVWAG